MTSQTFDKPISSDRFIWHGGVGYIEASELQGRHWDREFNVRSSKTGNVQRFVYSESVRTGSPPDDEVECFVFKSSNGLLIKVVND